MNRRAHIRFKLRAYVRFTWKLKSAAREVGEGEIRDLSCQGLFVLSESSPPEGASVKLNISFEGPHGRPQLFMLCRATVSRVESDNGHVCGFAAVAAAVAKRLALKSMPVQGVGERGTPDIILKNVRSWRYVSQNRKPVFST